LKLKEVGISGKNGHEKEEDLRKIDKEQKT
jgi:hypothetical protein